MRRLKRGDLDTILDEFLQMSAPIAFVDYVGVDPSYLKKQLTRKIKMRKDEDIGAYLKLNKVQLEHHKRSRIRQEGEKLVVTKIPTIQREFTDNEG